MRKRVSCGWEEVRGGARGMSRRERVRGGMKGKGGMEDGEGRGER